MRFNKLNSIVSLYFLCVSITQQTIEMRLWPQIILPKLTQATKFKSWIILEMYFGQDFEKILRSYLLYIDRLQTNYI